MFIVIKTVASTDAKLAIRNCVPVFLSIVFPLLFIYFLLPVYSGGDGFEGASQAVPGFTLMFSFFLIGNVAYSFFREREWGTWVRAVTCRPPLVGVVMGKSVVPFVVFAVQSIVVTAASVWLFRFQVKGSWWAYISVLLATAAFLVSLGFFLVAVCSHLDQVNALANVMAPVLAALGGALVPHHLLPSWGKVMAPWMPSHWSMAGLRTSIAAQPDISLLCTALCVLFVWAACLFLVGLSLMQRKDAA